jgi:hypothetical protein
MTGRPPDTHDDPAADDPVMLAVLSNKGQRPSPLSAEQERLLDDWVAGKLAPENAARAEGLTRENAWAAERVLERRLLEASQRDAVVPDALSAKILAAVAPPPTASPPTASPRRSWWQALQVSWTGALGLAALAVILVIALIPLLERSFQAGDTLQVAMADIADRGALFEPSDVRMRGPGPPPPAPTDLRFRDVEIPTVLLRDLAKAGHGVAAPDVVQALQSYLPTAGAPSPRIVLDAALKQRIDAATSERLPVRVYDLADPRAADIRKLLGSTGEGRAWLLTLKP